VLPDAEINTIFYKNGVLLHACVYGRLKDFFQGEQLVDFSKSFSRGGKVLKFVFYHSKLRKQPFFAEIFKFLPPFRHPCLGKKCLGKGRAPPLKNWCNFKRFTTILNSEILLNLKGKMKYLIDQYQLCFCFCIGNTK